MLWIATPITGLLVPPNTGVSGGVSDAYGYLVICGTNSVLGFSLTGETIPSGETELTTIELVESAANNQICLDEIIISGNQGSQVPNQAICGSKDFSADIFLSTLPVDEGGIVQVFIQSTQHLTEFQFSLLDSEFNPIVIGAASGGLVGK